MLEGAEALFEDQVMQYETVCRWMDALNLNWYQEPQWEGQLPKWHQPRREGPRPQPDDLYDYGDS